MRRVSLSTVCQASRLKRPGGGGRVQAGGEHDLTGVDVADAGQDAAVQEKIFEGAAPSPGCFCQPLGGRPAGKGLPAHLFQGSEGLARGKHQDLAEAPRVLKGQGDAALQGEKQVHVGAVVRRHAQEKAAGHAQVDEQSHAFVQPEEQVFPPPLQAQDAAAGEPFGQMLCRGAPAQALVPHRNREETPSHQSGGQSPANHLYFREFRHSDNYLE